MAWAEDPPSRTRHIITNIESLGSRFDPEADHHDFKHEKAQVREIWAFLIFRFGLVFKIPFSRRGTGSLYLFIDTRP